MAAEEQQGRPGPRFNSSRPGLCRRPSSTAWGKATASLHGWFGEENEVVFTVASTVAGRVRTPQVLQRGGDAASAK